MTELSNEELLAELDAERAKEGTSTGSDVARIEQLVEMLVVRGVYTLPPSGISILKMVEGYGARWFEWREPLACPQCGADWRDYKNGPPFKREIGIVAADRVAAWRCPDCNHKIPRESPPTHGFPSVLGAAMRDAAWMDAVVKLEDAAGGFPGVSGSLVRRTRDASSEAERYASAAEFGANSILQAEDKRILDELRARTGASPLEEAVAAAGLGPERIPGLDPGIRQVVHWLRVNGFNTTESGDGKTNDEDERFLDYPHVFMDSTSREEIFVEAMRLMKLLSELDIGPWDGVDIELNLSVFHSVQVMLLSGLDDALFQSKLKTKVGA